MDGIKGKTVLVTGASGFLGRHVLDVLWNKDCEVIAPTHEQFNWLRDYSEVEQQIHYYAPDTVIHLAAVCGGIGANQAAPGRFFFQNLIMGANLINACAVKQVEKFVQVGTVCSYPKFTPTPFKEEDLWNGYPEETNAPYGIAKKALLVQLQAYRQQYGFNGIYLIPVNLYGPGDNFDPQTSHVIPALIKKCIEARDSGKDEVEVWGTGIATREFLYVKDAAEGIVKAAESYDKPEPINLGNGYDLPITNLCHAIGEATKFYGAFKFIGGPDGQPKRQLDIMKAYREFGWEWKTRLSEGIRETVEWYESTRSRIVVPSV